MCPVLRKNEACEPTCRCVTLWTILGKFHDIILEILFDEIEIDNHLHGVIQDIHVSPYQNQKKLDLEKERMGGHFSYLEINTFLFVVG